MGQPDQIFPYFIVNEIPDGFSGFLIAAIFAAAISTLVTSAMIAAGIPGRMEKYCGGAAKLMLNDRTILNYRNLHAYFEEVGAQNIGILQQAFFEEGILAPRLSFILSTPMAIAEIDFIVEASHRALTNYKNRIGTDNNCFPGW